MMWLVSARSPVMARKTIKSVFAFGKAKGAKLRSEVSYSEDTSRFYFILFAIT